MALKSARMLEAPVSDPDRQEAVKITNFVAGRPLREVAAIYALALQMSLRGLSFEDYRNYWANVRKHFPAAFWRVAGLARELGVRLCRINGERAFIDEVRHG